MKTILAILLSLTFFQAFAADDFKADVEYVFTLVKIDGHLTNDKDYPIVCHGPFGGQTFYGYSIYMELEDKFLAPGQSTVMTVETTFAFHFIRAWDDIWCRRF